MSVETAWRRASPARSAPLTLAVIQDRFPSTNPDGSSELEIHKPKPVHNWRELASEVGAVVGIIIALSAEQLLESLE